MTVHVTVATMLRQRVLELLRHLVVALASETFPYAPKAVAQLLREALEAGLLTVGGDVLVAGADDIGFERHVDAEGHGHLDQCDRGRAHAFEEGRGDGQASHVAGFVLDREGLVAFARERHQAQGERILEVDRRGLAADATPERRASMVREPLQIDAARQAFDEGCLGCAGAAADHDRRQGLRARLEPVDEMAAQCLVAAFDKGHVATRFRQPFANGL